MSELRAAQVIGSFNGGGAQRLAWNLAAGLCERIDSYAVALKAGGLPRGEEIGEGRAVELAPAVPGPLGRLRQFLGFRRWLRRNKLDLVHVHGSGVLPFVVAATIGLGIRRVFTWHDSSEVLGGRLGRRMVRRWAARRCDLLFGSSRDVARMLADATGRRVEVWPNGVPEFPIGERACGGPPTIVWMGRFVPPKDPQALVRAARALRDEGLAFRVVMLGGALPHLRWFYDETLRLIEDAGLREVIETPGWIDDPRCVLRGAQIAVQTSHTEGLSLALLEQMMAGLAIVATDVGDTSVAIERGRSGLLIAREDDAALVEALRQLVSDRRRVAQLGEAARERAIESFSIASMAAFAVRQYGIAMGRAP